MFCGNEKKDREGNGRARRLEWLPVIERFPEPSIGQEKIVRIERRIPDRAIQRENHLVSIAAQGLVDARSYPGSVFGQKNSHGTTPFRLKVP